MLTDKTPIRRCGDVIDTLSCRNIYPERLKKGAVEGLEINANGWARRSARYILTSLPLVFLTIVDENIWINSSVKLAGQVRRIVWVDGLPF